MKARSETSVKYGDFTKRSAGNDFYAFTRVFGKHGVLVVLYVGEEAFLHFDATLNGARLPDKGVVLFRTGEAAESGLPGYVELSRNIEDVLMIFHHRIFVETGPKSCQQPSRLARMSWWLFPSSRKQLNKTCVDKTHYLTLICTQRHS